MSQSCIIGDCKHASRFSCQGCNQNFCREHLNEHDQSLNANLNPLADEIKALGDRLKALDIDTITGDARRKLEQWRHECHTGIDRFFQQKCQELDRTIVGKVEKQQAELDQLGSKAAKLIHEQEATHQDIDLLTSTIHHLKKEIETFERASFQVSTRPLILKNSMVRIEEFESHPFGLSTLPPPFRKIDRSNDDSWSFASNGSLLLIHKVPNLCLIDRTLAIVKQTTWTYGMIHDICWSSTIARFILTTRDEGIFLVDENTMSIEQVNTNKQRWWCITCSDTSLFLSRHEPGSSIIEFSLLPSTKLVKQWKSPDSCTRDEIITDIVYANKTLALIILNRSKKSKRIELRSSMTLNRIWSLRLDVEFNPSICRCCLLNNDEWIVFDHRTWRLWHITKDGKVKSTSPYNAQPGYASLFGPSVLVILTKQSINFHELSFGYNSNSSSHISRIV